MSEFSSVEIRLTPEFQRKVRSLAKKYRQIQAGGQPEFVKLKAGELPGDRLSGVDAEVLKLRVKNSDIKKGKSGGYRLIYWLQSPTRVVLIDLYTKSEQADVEVRKIRQIIASFQQREEEIEQCEAED